MGLLARDWMPCMNSSKSSRVRAMASVRKDGEEMRRERRRKEMRREQEPEPLQSREEMKGRRTGVSENLSVGQGRKEKRRG